MGNVHLILRKVAQKRFIHRNRKRLMSGPVAVQLLPAVVVPGMIQVQDAAAAAFQKKTGRVPGRLLFVAQDGVNVGRLQGSVEDYDGRLKGGFADGFVVLGFLLHKGGAHQNDAVDVLSRQQLYALLSGGQIPLAAAEQAAVLPPAEFPLQIAQRVGQIGVCGVGAQQADGLHAVQPQTAGKGVGDVAALFHDGQYPGPGGFADPGTVVQYPGNGGGGNAGLLGNIVNIHSRFLLLVSAYFCFALQYTFQNRKMQAIFD